MLSLKRMKKSSRAATFAALGFAALVIPLSLVLAQGNPLVPCTGTACQLCSLAKLGQNIINFTILLAIPIAAVLFAWAGALYITARGDTGQVEKAHGIFGKVALGFILALSGWLIVNTILVTIAKPGFGGSSGSFFTIQCVPDSSRPMNKKLSDLLGFANAPGGGYVSQNICPTDHPLLQQETGQCCQGPGFTDCMDPPKVDSHCTADYPSFNDNTYQCCKNADPQQCQAARPDPKCTADYPKYDQEAGQCCKFDDPARCKEAAQGGVKGKENQAATASGPLNSLIECLGTKTAGTITSISDDAIVGGGKTFEQCRTGGCAHTTNSCHYGGRSCGDFSYAVDVAGNNTQIVQAAQQCGASYNDEGNHVHVSIGAQNGCGCDAGLPNGD